MNFKFLFSLALLFGFGFVGTSLAQDSAAENVEAESVQVEMAVIDGDGMDAPMIFSTTTESFGDGVMMPPKVHIMSGSPGEMGFVGTKFNSAPDPINLINDASVQKDLELVDDQVTQLREMQREFSRELKDQIGDLSKGDFDKSRIKDIGKLVSELRAKQKTRMEQLLLPHQVDRLKQVALQKHMESAGTAGALGGKIADELGITDEQKEQLKQREKEIKQELAEKMAKMREEAREELLQVLNPDQRQKLKTMMGEKYKSDPKDWSDQRQRFRSPRRMRFNGS